LIDEHVFTQLAKRRITVFLVGAGRESPNSLRQAIYKELTSRVFYRAWFDVYYPEEIFEELIRGRGHFDLLSLENLLAKSVHSVVIILESPGAIAELGAFSNQKGLCDRLVVVVDEKYRKAKTFIMLGPVRYLNKKTKSIVIFHNLRNPLLEELGTQIREAVRRISRGVQIETSVANPIAAQHFILSAIYLMEPVGREILNEMVQAVRRKTPSKATTIIVTSSLNILLRQREVILRDGKYRLTHEGLERLRLAMKSEPQGRSIEHLLDEVRVKILNRTLRGQRKLLETKERAIQTQTSSG